MAKHLNVSLGFTADTSQAAQQIKQLQKQLQDLMDVKTGAGSQGGLTKEIQEALALTSQLRVQLQNATNVKTGNLDLSKFVDSMHKSGIELKDYQAKLTALGPAGQSAFANLTRSIATAEIPLKRTNEWLTQMGITLKNSIRWQLSSSMIHGFMGSVQTAWHYAQNLNESLNNIRIVTGQSTDQMAAFAEQANKAAKNLSTSTLSYTDAALIYYQQGLSDQQVKERTDVTVKMANVSRQSAEEVSDQMTAIWNNFAKGGENLEYYADVITALGAATASSSEEISAGLEKFAAIADTVGLSYENASAALATITATTRQSADTVGTGLRTLFSRLQSLSLGETLEDGVDLTKYTKALKTVGVDALDATGGLRDMDDILEDLAVKWQNLGDEQKTALAQTVGGVRQYTTLIALMDNWDFMEKNQQIAANAEGTLQKQADIYAESWEAAQKRVQASMESIYESLIDDDFFISLTNGVGKFIDSLGNIIDACGGVQGVLLGIGSVLTRVFSAQIGKNIENMVYNIKMLTGAGQKNLQNTQLDAINKLIEGNNDIDTTGGFGRAAAYASIGQAAKEVFDIQSSLNDEQMISVQQLQQMHIERAQLAIDTANELDQEEKLLAQTKNRLNYQVAARTGGRDSQEYKNYTDLSTAYETLTQRLQRLNTVILHLEPIDLDKEGGLKAAGDKVLALEQRFIDAGGTLEDALGPKAAAVFKELKEALTGTDASAEKAQAALDKMYKEIDTFAQRQSTAGANLKKSLISILGDKEGTAAFDLLAEKFEKVSLLTEDLGDRVDDTKASLQSFKGALNDISQSTMPIGQAISTLSSTVMSAGFALTSFKSIVDTLNNEDLSFFEKLVAIVPAASMSISGLTSIFSANTGQALRSVAATIQVATGHGFMATAAEGAKAANMGLGAALSTVGIALGVVASVIALVVVAYRDYTKDARKAKEATEELARSTTQLQDAKNAFEDLKNSIQDYKDSAKAIEELTVGTQAWTEQVKDCNAQVIELLQAYPKLAGYIDRVNGQLQISQEGLAFLEETGQNLVDTATLANLNANIAKNATQNQSDITNAGRKIQYTQTYDDGTVITAGVGNDIIEKAIDAISQSGIDFATTEEQFAQIMQDSGIANENVITALYDNRQSLITLATSVDANTAAMQIEQEEFTGEYLTKNSEYYKTLGKEEQSALNTVLAQVLDQDSEAYKAAYDNYADKWNGIKDSTLQEKYATAMGWDTTNIDNDSGYGVFHFNNSDEEIRVNDDTMRQYLAQQDALNNAISGGADTGENGIKTLGALIEGISAIGEQYGAASELLSFAGGKTGNFDNLTKLQQGQLLHAAALPSTITEDMISQIFGYDSREDFMAAISAAMDATAAELEQAQNGWANSVKEAFANISKDKSLSTNASIAIGDLLTSVFSSGGDKGLAAIVDSLEGLSEEQLMKFSEATQNIDWQNTNIHQLQSVLEEVGISSQFSTEALEALIAAMKEIPEVSQFDQLATKYATVHDVIDKLENDGTITAKEAQSLQEAGIELDDYFSRMADGSYKLEADAQEFYDYANGQTLEGFKSLINTTQEVLSNYDRATSDEIPEGYAEDQWQLSQANARLSLLHDVGVEGFNDEQVAEYQEQLRSGDSEIVANAASLILEAFNQAKDQIDSYKDENEKEHEDATEALGNAREGDKKRDPLSPENIRERAKEIKKQNDDINDGVALTKEMAEQYEDVARQAIKYDKAVEKVNDHYEDYEKLAKKISKDRNADLGDSFDDVQETMADMLGVEKDLIDEDFVKDHLQDMIDAVNGVDGAFENMYKDLDPKAFRDALGDLEINDEVTEAELDALVDSVADHFDTIDELADGMVIGDDVEVSSALYDELMTMMNETVAMALAEGASLDEAMNMAVAAVNSKGFDPPELEWSDETQIIHGKMPDGQQVHVTDVATIHNGTAGDTQMTSYSVTRLPGEEYDVEMPVLKPKDSGNGGTNTFTNTRPRSSGGTRKSSGGGGGGKKGGGGGGGSKAKDTKDVKDEQDRYHEIKEVLDDLTRQQDMLADAKDRAWGAARLAYIDQEKNKLGQLIDKQQVYLNQINSNLASDRSAIAAYGAKFDKAGRITNYNDLIAQQVNKFNNSARSDSDEEAYETFKKALEQYEETLNLQEEAQQEYVDLMNQLYDKQLEYITEAVDMNESVAQDQLEYLDYMLDKIDDDAFSAAEAIALLGEETATTLEQIDNYRKGIEDILNNHDNLTVDQREAIMNGTIDPETLKNLDFTADEIDTIRDYKSELLELNTTLREIREEIQEKLMDAYDAWNEKIEDQIDLYDHYEDIMEDYQDIVGLVGQDILGITDEMMSQFADIQMNNSINRLQSTRENYERLREQEAEARRQLAEAERSGNELEIKLWRETVDEMAETTREAEEEFMSTWVDTLEKAADKLQAAVERSTKAFEKGLAGNYGSLDSLRDFYDMQRESDDLKLKDYEKIYELSKLNRDIQSHIDDTDNVKAKKMLRDFQKEINDLQDSEGEMTEQQLQRLQKEYDLKLAQIALEEAQNAKDTVRLTKDSEGNWSYVYTAEEEDVSTQMQEYEDKLYEYQSLLEEQRQAIADFGLECIQEYEDMYAEIMSDATMNEEERNAKLAELQAWLNEQLQYQLEEGEAITEAQSELYQVDWQNYSDLTGYKISADDQYQDHFNETLLAQMLGVESEKELYDKVVAGMEQMQAECQTALETYEQETDRIMEAAGTSVEGYKDHMTDAYENIDEATQQTKDEISALRDQATSDFSDMTEAVNEWANNYAQTIDQIVAKNELLTKGLNALVKAQTDAAHALMPEEAEDDTQPAGGGGGGGGSGGSGGGFGSQITWTGNSPNRIFYTSKGNFHLRGTYKNGYSGSDAEARQIQQAWDRVGQNTPIIKWTGNGGILDAKKLGFASGGYTGDWIGDDGRLAILHSKELVLNKEDTANLLATVDLVRQISKVIDINASSQANGLGLLSAVAAKTDAQTLEQEVTIHAEFPNVQDHSEIEQAFNNLVNAASQFANRKNR